MVRTPCCDKNGRKKGTWTPEEDSKLIAYVTRYGSWNWRQLPKFAGLQRCGKSCRLRWMNYLRPDIKRGNYTQEEEETIITMQKSLGNRWSTIAAKLPGRTDNEVKNHWHTNLKKRVDQGPNTTTNEPEAISNNLISQTKTQNEESEANVVNSPNPAGTTSIIERPLSLCPQASSSDFSTVISNNSTATSIEDLLADNCLDFLEAYDAPFGGDFWSDLYVGDDYYLSNEFWEPLAEEEMLFSCGFQDHHYGSLN